MKNYLLFTFVIIALFVLTPLYCQLTREEQEVLIKEIGEELKYNEQLNQNIMELTKRIQLLKIVYKGELDNKIKEALNNNDINLAMQYFGTYSSILDTLVFTNPSMARKVVTKLRKIYSKVPDVEDDLYYYSGAIDFFQLAYTQAEQNLNIVLNQYPDSNKYIDAFSLLLKTYIVSNNHTKAIKAIEEYKFKLTPEQMYIAGQAYYIAQDDSTAAYYFLQVQSGAYKADAGKMLLLISALKDDLQKVYEQFSALALSEPDNPFILLTLARICSNLGKWQEAENYYVQYSIVSKTQSEIFSQYELALALNNAGYKDRAESILNELLTRKDLGDFTSPVLYLWSEIQAEKGQMNNINERLQNVTQQINVTTTNLPYKIDLLNRLNPIKETMLTNPSSDTVKNLIEQVKSISSELDTQNRLIQQNAIGLPQLSAKRLEIYEKQTILTFLDLMEAYIRAENLKQFPDTTNVNRLKELEKIYTEQVKKIEDIKATLIKRIEANPDLNYAYELHTSLEVYNNILNDINRLKQTGSSQYTPTELDSLQEHYSKRKAEIESELSHYSDYDVTEYQNITKEADTTVSEIKALIATLPDLREKFQSKYPVIISEKEKKGVVKDISNIVFVQPEYTKAISFIQTSLNRIIEDIRFINLNIAFKETVYYDKIKAQKDRELSYEASQQLFRENQVRKQAVYDKITQFIKDYPNYQGLRRPTGYPVQINQATLYYALAELSNSLWADKPAIALSYFRKVNELEPNFYLKDAVLYNIGYISSYLEQKRIENGIYRFELQASDQSKPDSLLYQEENFKEAINAYKQIINEYKDSPYYSEVVFRLGNLYFDIGGDANNPADYYAIARSFYDTLINNPEDKYRFLALYQRGWTWLNGSTEEAYVNAMNDFVAILKAIDEGAISDSTDAIDYTVAAIKNIGYCLVGLDKANTTGISKGAIYAKTSLAPLLNKKNRNQIIDEAIQQKLRLYLPMQAIDFMQVKIELSPLDVDNPVIADSICNIYSAYPNDIRSGTLDSVYFATKTMMVNNYGSSSEWYATNKDKDLTKQIKVLKKAFEQLELRYNNDFLKNPSEEKLKAYESLIGNYKGYNILHDADHNNWIKNKDANIIALYYTLAKLPGYSQYYLRTANKIYEYNDKYPDNKDYFFLEGCAYECVKTVNDSIRDEYLAIQSKNPDTTLPVTSDSLTTYYQTAAQRFMNILVSDRFRSPENELLYLNIVMRQAEIDRAKNQLETARKYYMLIINFTGQVPNNIKRSTYINLAEIADTLQNYVEAEKWYREAENYALDKNDKAAIHQLALIQIQNSIDKAKKEGNNALVANEYLRLSSEYTKTDAVQALKFKKDAYQAYLKAGQFDKSIELLLEMATTKDKPADVLVFYREAWTIADSVGMKDKSEALKQEFISKFSNSNEAFELRLAIIYKLGSNPETAKQAGDMYMALYQDVINKRIDPGTTKPEDLFLIAIVMYDLAKDEVTKETSAEQFITLYPKHPEVIRLMDYLAGRMLAKGDTLRYEKMAKEIYQKDKTQSARYENVVKAKLRKIYDDFTKAYLAQNWTVAFAKRDEFIKAHSAYEKEGLKLDFSPIYDAFKTAEKDYKEYQDKIAFLKRFDAQLNTIEADIIKKKPADLVKVNVNTKWKANLTGGKDNRFKVLIFKINNHIKTISQLLETGTKYNMDNTRRLKALDLIVRLNEHGALVIRTQTEQYMKSSYEFRGLLTQVKGNEDLLYAQINEQKEGYASIFTKQSDLVNKAIYKLYYIPGIRNQYTLSAYSKLINANILPRFRFNNYPINSSWQFNLLDLSDTTNVVTYQPNISTISLPNGVVLSNIEIPENKVLVLNKIIQSKIAPDYAYVYLTSPYYEDTIIKVNNEKTFYTIIPIDTLVVNDPLTIRYSLTFGEEQFKDGQNTIELRLYNYTKGTQKIAIHLMTVIDSLKIEAAIPIEEKTIDSDTSWMYRLIEGNQPSAWKSAIISNQFGFSKAQMYEMEQTKAEPIWVMEEDQAKSEIVQYRRNFNLEGVFQEGYLQFIAPDVATIKLNGQELIAESPLNYDPIEDKEHVFPGKVTITKDMLRQGTNTLEITVVNKSEWKGIVASLFYKVALPE